MKPGTRVFYPAKSDVGTVVGMVKGTGLPPVYTIRLDRDGSTARVSPEEVRRVSDEIPRRDGNVVPFPAQPPTP